MTSNSKQGGGVGEHEPGFRLRVAPLLGDKVDLSGDAFSRRGGETT